MNKWNYKPGWIKWSRKWHRIVRFVTPHFSEGVFATLCGSIPPLRRDFPDCEYSRVSPVDNRLCIWCTDEFLKNRKGTRKEA